MIKTLLGSYLVENNIVTNSQLEIALEYQKKNLDENMRLGTALVELGFCDDEDITKAISKKTGFDFVSLNNQEIDILAINAIPPEIAKKHKAIGIGFENDKILVAMANPNDILAIDDITLITGYKVKPIVVSDIELHGILNKYNNNLTEISLEEEVEIETETLDAVQDAEKPAVMLVSQILNNGIKSSASDIHIEALEKSMRVRYRIDGVLHSVMEQSNKLHASVVSRIKVMAGMDIAERRSPQDGRATIKTDGKVVDLRIATLPSAYGEKITIRILNRNARNATIQELGFPDSDYKRFMKALQLPYGFMLVTGPTGSGKSTTLYAALSQLNTTEKNLITLEDPVERRMIGINQVQMNAKANMTFASGLRSILRSDPDIIMIGEIRDRETAQIAVESALTGHFVLSTLHTNDSASAVTRLGEMGVENFLTSSSLVGVIAQRLVRVLCPRCKVAHTYTKEQIFKLVEDFPIDATEENVTIYHPKGCIACNNTGYKGRRGVYEFLSVTEEIRSLILAKASSNEIDVLAKKQGMTSLRENGFLKVKDGITSIEEVLRVIV